MLVQKVKEFFFNNFYQTLFVRILVPSILLGRYVAFNESKQMPPQTHECHLTVPEPIPQARWASAARLSRPATGLPLEEQVLLSLSMQVADAALACDCWGAQRTTINCTQILTQITLSKLISRKLAKVFGKVKRIEIQYRDQHWAYAGSGARRVKKEGPRKVKKIICLYDHKI